MFPPSAPAPATRLCRLEDIADGGTRDFSFGEGHEAFPLFIVRRGGAVYGYVNVCPHRWLPLDWKPGEFLTHDGKYIFCANHAAIFRIEDGQCVGGPCAGARLMPVNLRIGDGEVAMGPWPTKPPQPLP